MIKIVYTITSSILLVLLLGKAYPDHIDTQYIGIILSINFLSFLLFFLKKENDINLRKQQLKASSLFIIGFVVVHFQMYLDVVLGYISDTNSILFINNRIALKSLLISSIAFNLFCLGYILNQEKNIKQTQVSSLTYSKPLKTKVLFLISIILLLLYFSPNESGPWGTLFECAISALLILKSRNLVLTKGYGIQLKKVLYSLKEAIIPLSVYLIYLLVTGERGTIIFNGLFLAGIIAHVSNLKLNGVRLLLLIVVSSSILTLLGVARKFEDESSFIDKLNIALNTEETDSSHRYPNSILPSTKELASSGRILNIAVNEIEQGASHTYGLFVAQDLMLLFPSLRSTFVDTFNIPYILTGSPEYFTYIDLGKFPTWGVGTSCVADTYTDFGIVGVVIIYFAFGFFVRKLDLTIYRKTFPNYILFTLSLLVLSFSIYISRSSLLYFLNKLPYIVIFIYFTVLINKIKPH
ncbi:O-antigen polysaccharide polymerase Wzy [Capnocytophaga cynodegmi]|uniref:O-antigen polysaccharide polymerase Wzy n=1 Tax=Capnocytophaga cynodegmi TaxID=28189 RepID=UPI00385CC13B